MKIKGDEGRELRGEELQDAPLLQNEKKKERNREVVKQRGGVISLP